MPLTGEHAAGMVIQLGGWALFLVGLLSLLSVMRIAQADRPLDWPDRLLILLQAGGLMSGHLLRQAVKRQRSGTGGWESEVRQIRCPRCESPLVDPLPKEVLPFAAGSVLLIAVMSCSLGHDPTITCIMMGLIGTPWVMLGWFSRNGYRCKPCHYRFEKDEVPS